MLDKQKFLIKIAQLLTKYLRSFSLGSGGIHLFFITAFIYFKILF
jgi:hypothetical protein